MGHETSRRERLAEDATDYVLEHGIAGLSLRPLAAALGTSDRMLLYHFGSKDALVAEVDRAQQQPLGRGDAGASRRRDRPGRRSPRCGVAGSSRPSTRCLRVYAQTAALGLLGQEPYLSAAQRSNQLWGDAVADLMARSGVPRAAGRQGQRLWPTPRCSGCCSTSPSTPARADVQVVVRDLADAVQRISSS